MEDCLQKIDTCTVRTSQLHCRQYASYLRILVQLLKYQVWRRSGKKENLNVSGTFDFNY